DVLEDDAIAADRSDHWTGLDTSGFEGVAELPAEVGGVGWCEGFTHRHGDGLLDAGLGAAGNSRDDMNRPMFGVDGQETRQKETPCLQSRFGQSCRVGEGFAEPTTAERWVTQKSLHPPYQATNHYRFKFRGSIDRPRSVRSR